MPTLSTYTAQVRRLLHDANASFYSATDVTVAINEGRKRVALDTGCLRTFETISMPEGQETYILSAESAKGENAVDLNQITVLWGATRWPLFWMAFTEFQTRMRVWQSNLSRPAVWSNFGSGPNTVVYVQPVPDQDYSSYWDIFYVPEDLVDDNSTDEIVYPFADAVQFFAAYQCKFKEQNFGESALFENQYKQRAAWAISTTYTRRMPNAYAGYTGGVS